MAMSMNAIIDRYVLRMKYLNFSPESQTIILFSNCFMFNDISVNELYNSLFEGWYSE